MYDNFLKIVNSPEVYCAVNGLVLTADFWLLAYVEVDF